MPQRDGVVTAHRISHELRPGAGHPDEQWKSAQSIRFSADWRGQDPDPELETEVRLLWSPSTLYLRFACRYRELFVFADCDPNGRRDQLWERDVAEAFLQPPGLAAKAVPLNSTSRYRAFYREFEIAPNGMWIDLDISPSGPSDLKSALTHSVHISETDKTWAAELAIPMDSLTANFDPTADWRVNFFRAEGNLESRAYLAWRPTHTPQPDFHVPEAFGVLRFTP